jgi:hypothetical protein
MIRAACTIVSLNYIPYARALCKSFLKFYPDCRFYVLLVDRVPEGLDLSHEDFELVLVEDLGIPDFKSAAFKFGIVELNTNVKPTFLLRLFERGIDKLIYLDPDILIYSSLDLIFAALDENGIVLTPHSLSPDNAVSYNDVLLLVNGVFNLGFIAVSNTPETNRFLHWWEDRCLTLGYNERWAGLFVDQKWLNLAPCFYDSVKILKHPGCNVAYWNMHERKLEIKNSSRVVNGNEELVFFHFSGVEVDGGDGISKHYDRIDLVLRPDVADLIAEYRKLLVENGIRDFARYQYAFGRFYDGTLINRLQRAAFAANLDQFRMSDPFDPKGPFFEWAKQRHLMSRSDTAGKYRRQSYNLSDKRVRLVNALLRLALRVLGADRYSILMKYFEYASILRNQNDIIG